MLDHAVNVRHPARTVADVTEEPLQFGDGGRVFGILTLPPGGIAVAQRRPVFVFLNAGVLHRVGPLRMYVRLARALAGRGFAALRVDLSGTGDSPPRSGLTYRESVAADFSAIEDVLEARLGRGDLIVIGLCSAADNAIRLAPRHPRIVGMVLLDPICFEEPGFRRRALTDLLIEKLSHPLHSLRVLQRQAAKFIKGKRRINPLSLRDLPDADQMRDAFRTIRQRGGHALSIFTSYATLYYNRHGQLGRVLDVEGYDAAATELFWPDVEHTYMLDVHRRRLIDAVVAWADEHFAAGTVTAGGD